MDKIDHTPLISPNGKPVAYPWAWDPPQGSHPYFGFITPAGPVAVAMSHIVACIPQVHPQTGPNGNFMIFTDVAGAPPIPLGAEDAFKLLKRMGWKDRANA